jgi:multicomponent Na+:H+ antiporter subunit E
MKRFLLFAAISAVIFEAQGTTLIFAAAAAAAAALVMRRLPPRAPTHVRVRGMVAFVPYFFRESVRGGVDVAVRAFRGPRTLEPGFVDYPLRLHSESARVAFANAVSLMPGTFTAGMHGDALRVHALDVRAASDALLPRLRSLEDRLDAIFAEPPA